MALSPTVWAAPTVNSTSYDQSANTVTIIGSGFGAGPKVELYDDFEASTARVGEDIPLSASPIGSWTSANQYYRADYTATARSGKFGFRAWSHEKGQPQPLTKKFPATQEVFLSYWVKLNGDYFPGDNVPGPRQFPTDSSWKFTWLMETDGGRENPNLCLPTHVGNGRFMLAGNSHNLSTNITNSWWSWNNWMRITVWLKANESDPLQPGKVLFQALSKEKGLFEVTSKESIFNNNNVFPKQYKQLNIPGWIRSVKDPNTEIVYDDVYLAVGSNAAARVEIGNAPNYKDVTHLELQMHSSWTSGEIKFNLNKGTFSSLNGLYVFVTDKDGNVSKGIPLGDAASPPVAPVLKVANQ